MLGGEGGPVPLQLPLEPEPELGVLVGGGVVVGVAVGGGLVAAGAGRGEARRGVEVAQEPNCEKEDGGDVKIQSVALSGRPNGWGGSPLPQ